ncbi:UNVERIFIED_CONTAM: hypothetical protein GTU68_034696 [Idotea baltica]|nr:hypothetical protein [Idotea baltica]
MFLEIQHVRKSFGKDVVVRDLSISLARHKTLSILGKSGCGKTTMLKIIAGLVAQDQGSIFVNGINVDAIPPEKRNIVYLYQQDLLFPHLSIFENIAFGLRIKKLTESVIQERVTSMISSLELESQAKKMPHQLSGGQRQRVSFGRAIITNPSLLLLDEPFGSLDTGTRERMQLFFKKLAADFDTTSLFVTHDLKEAILMGDEIGLMEDGKIKRYKSKRSFIEDPSTGVDKEMNFWKNLIN